MTYGIHREKQNTQITTITNVILTWESPTVWVWWVLTDGVFVQSSLLVHYDYWLDLTNNGPVPLEESPHTEHGTVVPETHFLLFQKEQIFHMQLQASEKGTKHVAVTFSL